MPAGQLLQAANQLPVGDLVKVIRESDAEVFVVVWPYLTNLRTAYPFAEAHRKIDDLLNRLNVAHLDLYETFRGYEDRRLWVKPVDSHPSSLAMAIAGEAIAKVLKKRWTSAENETTGQRGSN